MDKLFNALKGLAASYRDASAVLGAFAAGGVFVAAAMGALTLPKTNERRIAALEDRQEALETQTAAVVSFVQAQAIFTCAIAAKLDTDHELPSCTDIQGVVILPESRRY